MVMREEREETHRELTQLIWSDVANVIELIAVVVREVAVRSDAIDEWRVIVDSVLNTSIRITPLTHIIPRHTLRVRHSY